MSLKELFKQAKIHRVAIVDDDLRTTITQADVSNSSPNDDDLNSLSDATDPDFIEFHQFLATEDLPRDNVDQMLAALEIDDVRARAPARYKAAAERVLARREPFASRVMLAKDWLQALGVKPSKFKIYTNPAEVDLTEKFDLLLIDYFLVNDSNEFTIPLIKDLLAAHENERLPLLVILMSSHEAQLQADFNILRPELERTSSRFRLMLKPTLSTASKSFWHCTFEQLASERSVVIPIEKFIKAWSEKLKLAADKISNGLWSLDAHALSILSKTAEEDHLSLEEYFGDLLTRRVLAEVEHADFPATETALLTKALSAAERPNFDSEIGDSRLALRKIVVDIAWHRQNWWKPKKTYPRNSTQRKFEWLKRHVRFGTVLRRKTTREYLVNITQACDVAHVPIEEIKLNHMLFLPGEEGALHNMKIPGKYASSYSFDKGNAWINLFWNLRQPRTPSMNDFLGILGGYEIVGQLRQDQAQDIAAQFSHLTSRIATIKPPGFAKFYGFVFGIVGAGENAVWEIKSSKIIAHTNLVGPKQKINFDVSNAQIALDTLAGIHDVDASLRSLITGFDLKLKSEMVLVPSKLKGCLSSTEAIDLEANFQEHPELVKFKEQARPGVNFLLLWPEEN
ncbi:MAG: hypothetical protein CVU15_05490 [Betaproteobacteria bacterium HGW-Betaproteobacteria-1]|jgi:hypothetical protein|nr:MAG: hypothetical protein CVU15_05490 [Betaproteobacteria bacterium HGW-Betaproteobacteria-1]